MDAQPATDQELLSFRITGTGQVLFRGRDVGLSGVRVTVLNYIQQEKAPVIIEVEDDAPAGIMVRVMDEAQYAGAEEISVKPASN
jgi:biopolymer transport protein ExbD